MANSVGIFDINAKRTTVTFKFEKERITPEVCIKLLGEFSSNLTVSSSQIPTLIYRNNEPYKLFDNIKFLLHAIIRLNNEEK